MNIDGLTLSFLTRELEKHLLDAQIQKVNQIDKFTIVFKTSSFTGSENLFITVGQNPSIYLGKTMQDLPKEPSGLLMYLRKLLEGSRITAIEQIHDDRVIKMTLDRLALNGSLETKELYIELMGKHSNAILVENGIILESLIHVSPFMSQERQIGPKIAYELPPNANRMSVGDFDTTTVLELLKNYKEGNLSYTIRKLFNGFGNTMVDEVAARAGISVDADMDTISEGDLISLAQSLVSLYKDIHESEFFYAYEGNTKKKIYSAVPLHTGAKEIAKYEAISPLLEEESLQKGGIDTAARRLETMLQQALKKEQKRNEKIKDELAETKEASKYKEYGDLLMIYSYLPHNYETEITVDNYLVDPPTPITIPLKKDLTITENAQQAYKMYRKLKNRKEHSVEQLAQSREKMDYISSIIYSLQQNKDSDFIEEIRLECEDMGFIKKQKNNLRLKGKTSEILTIPFEEGRILIGRNNKQNDQLTHRMAAPTDIWFHTLKIPGSHVVLQLPREATEEELLTVASYAAYYSQGRQSSKVPVDMTEIRHVKKPPKSPLGFVTYTHQNTVYVTPQEPPLEGRKED